MNAEPMKACGVELETVAAIRMDGYRPRQAICPACGQPFWTANSYSTPATGFALCSFACVDRVAKNRKVLDLETARLNAERQDATANLPRTYQLAAAIAEEADAAADACDPMNRGPAALAARNAHTVAGALALAAGLPAAANWHAARSYTQHAMCKVCKLA